MNYIFKDSLNSQIILYVLLGVIFGILIVTSTYSSLFILLSIYILLLLLVSESPLKLLSLFIIMIPFSKTNLFGANLLNLTGLKPSNLLALFVMIIAIVNYKKSFKMPKYAFFFTLLFLIIFSVSCMRVLPNLDTFGFLLGKKLSPLEYLLSFYFRPLLFFMPFVIMIKFSRNFNHIEHITKILYFSVVVFSFYILFLVLRFPGRDNPTELTNYYILMLNMHKNGVADFFIAGFPIVLLRFFLKKDIYSILSIALTVTVIGFTYSRTAYFVTIFSIILYLIISKRKKILPAFLVVAVGLILVISSSNIIERAVTGFESQDSNEISAGRIEGIWFPLIDEYVENPKKLLFGNGRYALVTSVAMTKGLIPVFAHSHNMYLDLILDTGILGFITLMPFFIVFLKRAYKSLNKIQDPKIREYQYAVIVSLVSFFISGLAGRTFFPITENSYFWCILGIEIAILNIMQNSEKYVYAQT